MLYRRARHSSSKTSSKKSASTASLSGQCGLFITSSFILKHELQMALWLSSDHVLTHFLHLSHSQLLSHLFSFLIQFLTLLFPHFFQQPPADSVTSSHLYYLSYSITNLLNTLLVADSDSSSCPLCLSDQVLCRAVTVVTANSGNSRHRRLLSCYSHR